MNNPRGGLAEMARLEKDIAEGRIPAYVLELRFYNGWQV
jgi:hypothetical protein